MKHINTISLSIITATYNSAKHISHLIKSLQSQTNKNFEWVIADGHSTDGTIEIINEVHDLNIKITSQKDFGIYDAINRGIKESSGEYYIVIGSDDMFYPDAIENFLIAIQGKECPIITAKVKSPNKIWCSKKKNSWINKQFAYISSHAVGTAFQKSLHEKYGYYSSKYPIAADQFFILTACKSGEKVKTIDCIVGEFSTEGISSMDVIGTLCESFRIQIIFHNKYFQIIIFIAKILKNIKKI